MTASLEVRWFYPGALPASLRAWFGTPEEAVRTDVYGRPASPDLNVKIRGEALEVKRRTAPPAPMHFADGLAGYAEAWTKWRFPLPQAGAFADLDRSNATHWIPVQKTRALRRFVVSEDGLHPRTAPPAPEACSCDVELTHLVVAGAPWWSLCLETSGPQDRQRDALLLAAVHVFDDAAPPLDLAHSCSYPAWLIAQTAHPGTR